MSGREGKVNGVLFGVCLALCVASAGFLSESSSAPYVAEPSETSAVIVADTAQVQEKTEAEEAVGEKQKNTEEATEAAQTPEPTEAPSPDAEEQTSSGVSAGLIQNSPYEVSPEASRGNIILPMHGCY